MNEIERVRDEIKKYFDANQFIENSQKIFVSRNEKFRLETSNYHQAKNDVNWDVTKVEIFDNQSNETLFEFFSSDGGFFHSWLETKDVEYLICAEDLFGGQTIIDLTNKKMSSFSENQDGFIWTEFHLSPDGKTLAIIGCFWACPFVIKLYDFRNPLELPLREIKEVELIGTEKIVGWLDNNSFKTKGIKAEYEEEPHESGGIRFKPIGETEIERVIKIHDQLSNR